MRLYAVLFVVLTNFCILVSGCHDSNIKTMENNIILKEATDISCEVEFDTEISDKDHIREINLLYNETSGEQIVSQTIVNDTIYIAVEKITKSNPIQSVINIYTTTVNKNECKKLTEFKIEINTSLSELKASEEYLFWVEESTNGNWRICYLNLISHEIKVLRDNTCSSSTIPICLVLSESYLSWYENEFIDKDEIYKLCIYNIESNEYNIISNKVFLFTPYDRAHIRDNVVTFVESDKYNKIVAYDLENKYVKSEILLSEEDIVLNPVNIGNYTVWHDGYKYAKIYIYNNLTQKTFLIDCKTINISLFSIVFIDQYIFINDRQSNNILQVDIDNYKISNISQEFSPELTKKFVLTDKTYHNKFTAVKYTDKGFYYFQK